MQKFYLTVLVLFFVISCKNNPTNSNQEPPVNTLPPPDVTNLSFSFVDTNLIQLNWSTAHFSSDDFTFEISRRTNSDVLSPIDTIMFSSEYEDTFTLIPDTEYQYSVKTISESQISEGVQSDLQKIELEPVEGIYVLGLNENAVEISWEYESYSFIDFMLEYKEAQNSEVNRIIIPSNERILNIDNLDLNKNYNFELKSNLNGFTADPKKFNLRYFNELEVSKIIAKNEYCCMPNAFYLDGGKKILVNSRASTNSKINIINLNYSDSVYTIHTGNNNNFLTTYNGDQSFIYVALLDSVISYYNEKGEFLEEKDLLNFDEIIGSTFSSSNSFITYNYNNHHYLKNITSLETSAGFDNNADGGNNSNVSGSSINKDGNKIAFVYERTVEVRTFPELSFLDSYSITEDEWGVYEVKFINENEFFIRAGGFGGAEPFIRFLEIDSQNKISVISSINLPVRDYHLMRDRDFIVFASPNSVNILDENTYLIVDNYSNNSNWVDVHPRTDKLIIAGTTNSIVELAWDSWVFYFED